MNRTIVGTAFLMAAAAWGLQGFGQEKPLRAAPRCAVIQLRQCFDKDRVEGVREIDQELQRFAEDITKRMKDADPKDRERLKQEYMAFYEGKKLALYLEISRIAEAIGRENHYALVLKADPYPSTEGASISVTQQIGERGILFHDGSDDITEAVIKRLNESTAERKKKAGEKKDKDF